MRVLRSILFRFRRLLVIEHSARPDVVSRRKMRKWRLRLESCSVEADLEVRGHPEAVSRLFLGAKVGIDRQCIFWLADDSTAKSSIILGDRTYIGPYTFLGSHEPLEIGRDTIIGAYSYLITGNHSTSRRDIPYRDQGYDGAPIRIGSNVWLGCHVVVLPGVTIGDGAIVGAGAVVTRDIPAGETWGGVPARPLSERKAEGL